MPPSSSKRYSSNTELPGSIRKLAPAAQSAYRQAYNDAWSVYSPSQETTEKGARATTRAQEAHEAGLKAATPPKRAAARPVLKTTSRKRR